MELNWIGEGDLSGLLAAQPLPENVSQVFHGSLDAPETAAVFAQGGMLAVPSIVDDVRGHVAEALAAGLPVVGSRRSREVRQHVTDGVTGWLFDPLTPGNTLDGVTRALGTTGQRLAEMRLRARAAVSAAPPGTTPARVEHRDRSRLPAMHSAAQGAS